MPEGTTPQAAAAHAAQGPASRGLRIGNVTIPWWAVGLGAVGVGLVGFLIYRNMQSQGPSAASSGSSAGTPTSPGVTSAATPTAATLVPLPYPTASSTTGNTATAASGLGTVTLGAVPGASNPGIWQSNVAAYSSPTSSTGTGYSTIPYGSYSLAGSPVSVGGNTFYPIVGPGGQEMYALGENVLGYNNPSASSLSSTQLAGSAA